MKWIELWEKIEVISIALGILTFVLSLLAYLIMYLKEHKRNEYRSTKKSK